jgi:hypothetical protein
MRSLLRHVRVYTLVAVSICAASAIAQDNSPWTRVPRFGEQSFTTRLPSKVRIHVNAPLAGDDQPLDATRLIIYALPNGNTIEQTLGCRMTEGLDWHYDIQHVAAQVRLLRSLMPDDRIVLVCAEAPQLTWPHFRSNVPDANAAILQMVDEWRKQFGGENTKVMLTGHSGGGSFMFGVIEAADEIPDFIDRIAFLDANYSFDVNLHAAKFERWLNGDERRRLMVLAYDDREITLNGKKVVSPTGGTFRATGRMRDALAGRFDLTETETPTFKETVGLGGRIHFYVHPNPANKILHTALVGEMNGLLHVATLGTPNEKKWGKFGGPRAYKEWVQSHPTPKEDEPPETTKNSPVEAPALMPPRPAGSVGGTKFIESIQNLSFDEREAAIRREIASGNFPEFLRRFKKVPISGMIHDESGAREITTTLDVMPDYLAVGADDNFVRIPMTPQTAQQIADRFGCMLPTRKMVDAIDAQAEARLAPHPLTRDREAVTTFLEHHEIIEKQRDDKRLSLLITGIKKDVVLSPRIFERPERLAIYGWRQVDGKPIQPLTIVHWDRYVDYSHGARLVRNSVEIDGRHEKITDLLADPNRCGLVSDEGPMKPPRYPLD